VNEEIMRDYFLNLNKIIAGNSNKIDLNNNIINKLIKYVVCVEKWGRTHNIVSGKFSQEDILENIYDSVVGGIFLSVKEEVYDAGSGGGFPGVLLAVIFPKTKFYLIESNRKKCSFLRVVKNTLELDNIVIINDRLESFVDLSFITSKAAFSLLNVGLLWDALAQDGKLALWSTNKSGESFVSILSQKGAKLIKSFDYELPQGQKRCILLFTKN